jgi:hypothetical protein
MKPSAIQIFFADEWLTRIWISMFVFFSLIYLYQRISPSLDNFLSISFVFTFTVAVICVTGISYLASLVIGCMILPPIFQYREKLNGAPFKKGDCVIILKRSRRGQTARIDSPGDRIYGAYLHLEDGEKMTLPYTAIARIS